MDEAPRFEANRLKLCAITLAVSALALVLRLHALGRESLWLDEGFTWERSSLPLPELFQHAIRGHHNPTYFVLVHYWLGMVGDDEFQLRLPSAVAGAFSAGACVWLGYALHGLAAGFVAGFVLALAPLQVQYGQEARMYSLLCFTATTAMIGIVWLLRNPARAAVPILGTGRWWRSSHPTGLQPASGAWSAYILGTIGSLYMHNTTVVFAASAALAVILGIIGLGSAARRIFLNFVAASLIVLLVWGLYLSTELQQAKTFASAAFWAKFPTGRELVIHARELFLMTARLHEPLAWLLMLAFVLGLWELRRNLRVALTMLVLCLVGPALLLLVSLYKPIFGTRMLLWAAAPFSAVVGAGVASLRHVAAPLVFAIAVAALGGPTLAQQYAHIDKEPWREVVKTIEAHARPQALAVPASGEEALMLRYYQRRRSYPLGTVRSAAAKRGTLPTEARDAPQLFLMDRKKGRRTARPLRELTRRGYTTHVREFRNLRLFELTRPP